MSKKKKTHDFKFTDQNKLVEIQLPDGRNISGSRGSTVIFINMRGNGYMSSYLGDICTIRVTFLLLGTIGI